MKNLHQPDLFGTDLPTAPENSSEPRQPGAVMLIAVGAGSLNAQQRTFNKLSLDIDAERAKLQEWQDFSMTLGSKFEQEYHPAQAQLEAMKRRFVIQADIAFQQSLEKGGKRLNKSRKNKLQDLILDIIDGLDPIPGETADAELDAIFERYAGYSAAEHREIEMMGVEALLADELGVDAVRGHKAETLDELLMHAREKIFSEEAKKAENRENRRAERHEKSGRISPAAAQKAQAERDMKQTVREIYRKLASELHPDRESDADERARKTALMQRINAAYEANNLLDLLNLQMEVAQLSEHMLSAIPAERLKNYIKVMQEQLRTLKKESKEILDRFAASFNLARFERPKTIAEALQIFSEEVNEINQTTAEVEYDCRAIIDINQRDRCIDRLS